MPPEAAADLYEDDFFAWTRLQAKELRRFADTRPNAPLDLAHIAEEIEDLGKAQRNTVRALVRRILEHLLLLEHSPAAGPRPHWISEVVTFRDDLADQLTRTLQRDLRRQLPELYATSRRATSRKLDSFGEAEAAARLPETCPYNLDQILGDWFPVPVPH
jgi:hypothetical protein